ncbi:PorV/PorQ family protein [bacterium]|nr:PorV/PorQ family protein [bacterium]
MRKWVLIVGGLLGLALPSLVWGQAKVGTAGVQFLKISPSCRAVGMGEAFVAVSNDASAIWHNPAGLVQLDTPELILSLIDYPAGVQYAYGGMSHPFPRLNGAGALSFIYLGTDEMEETTPERPNGTGRTFTAGDLAICATYTQRLTNKFSVGGTMKFISETLADKSATGWAADVGTFYDTAWRSMKIGMLISNFGPDMKFVETPFPMPMNFTFGMSAHLINSSPHRLLGAFAWSHPNDNLEVYNLGLEYSFANTAYLRFGKKINGTRRVSWFKHQEKVDAGESADNYDPFVEYPLLSVNGSFFENGATFGAGAHFDRIGLAIDYAFTGIAFLGDIHRFSLTYTFSKNLF